MGEALAPCETLCLACVGEALAPSTMPPKGGTGMSQADKTAASLKLQKKIDDFVEMISAKNITEPDKALLQEAFSATELQALWQRFKTARGREPATVEEAWATLGELGSKKAAEARTKTLLKYLANQDDKIWAEYLFECRDEVTREKMRRRENKPLYKGELEQIHGKAEAAKHIKEKKWAETEDAAGEVMYVKVQDTLTMSKGRKQTFRGTRHL